MVSSLTRNRSGALGVGGKLRGHAGGVHEGTAEDQGDEHCRSSAGEVTVEAQGEGVHVHLLLGGGGSDSAGLRGRGLRGRGHAGGLHKGHPQDQGDQGGDGGAGEIAIQDRYGIHGGLLGFSSVSSVSSVFRQPVLAASLVLYSSRTLLKCQASSPRIFAGSLESAGFGSLGPSWGLSGAPQPLGTRLEGPGRR